MVGISFTDYLMFVLDATCWYILVAIMWYLVEKLPRVNDYLPLMTKKAVTIGWVIFIVFVTIMSSSLHFKRSYQVEIDSQYHTGSESFNRGTRATDLIDKSRQPSSTSSEERAENTRKMLDWRESDG